MNEWRLLEGSGKRNSNFPNSSYLTSKKKKKKILGLQASLYLTVMRVLGGF